MCKVFLQSFAVPRGNVTSYRRTKSDYSFNNVVYRPVHDHARTSAARTATETEKGDFRKSIRVRRKRTTMEIRMNTTHLTVTLCDVIAVSERNWPNFTRWTRRKIALKVRLLTVDTFERVLRWQHIDRTRTARRRRTCVRVRDIRVDMSPTTNNYPLSFLKLLRDVRWRMKRWGGGCEIRVHALDEHCYWSFLFSSGYARHYRLIETCPEFGNDSVTAVLIFYYKLNNKTQWNRPWSVVLIIHLKTKNLILYIYLNVLFKIHWFYMDMK